MKIKVPEGVLTTLPCAVTEQAVIYVQPALHLLAHLVLMPELFLLLHWGLEKSLSSSRRHFSAPLWLEYLELAIFFSIGRAVP